jgi:hypothetical protein
LVTRRWGAQRCVPDIAILLKLVQLIYASLPEANLNFSKVWSTSLAIESALTVSLHPCFNPTKYYFLCETISLEDIDLRVAPEALEIRLCEHSLYRHEYISSPPLQDLRVMIVEDEGPLAEVEESDLSFQVNPWH